MLAKLATYSLFGIQAAPVEVEVDISPGALPKTTLVGLAEAAVKESIHRIERALALYMVVAWRINRLMRLGRTCPDLPAALLFEVEEIQAAYVLNKKAVPEQTPDLNTVVRLIARLGGFLGRKSDGEPGVKTLWLGFQRITDFANGIRFTRSGMT